MYEIREIGKESFSEIKGLFKSVFTAPPWNDDWSNDNQLTEYLLDLMQVRTPLEYGFYEDGMLIGISIGNIRHWWGGTEYFIEEFCIKTDMHKKGLGSRFLGMIEESLKGKGIGQIFLMTEKDVPAFEFYKKNGFEHLEKHASFFKSFQ